MTNLLNRQQCQALRGIAIIGIFLHNYCHWLKGIVRENEYQYFERNVSGLDGVMANTDWNLPLHLLSFFGHYGVPLFLFLSAYGLVLKYEAGPSLSSGWAPLKGSWRFVRYHFLKLFKMMVAGYVAFVLVDFITPHHHHYQLLDIVAQLLMRPRSYYLARSLLVFRPDAATVHRLSIAALSAALGSNGGFDGGVHVGTTADVARE